MSTVVATSRQRAITEMAAAESATETMPTVADAIFRAAAMLSPILPPHFWGVTIINWEDGHPKRMEKVESIKL